MYYLTIDDHSNISGSCETMRVLSLLHEASQLALPIAAWFTVPVCPPKRCTIFFVVVSQMYTHLSVEPQQT